MTPEEQIEWNYRYSERLAILCGASQPTEAQIEIAKREADEGIERLSMAEFCEKGTK